MARLWACRSNLVFQIPLLRFPWYPLQNLHRCISVQWVDTWLFPEVFFLLYLKLNGIFFTFWQNFFITCLSWHLCFGSSTLFHLSFCSSFYHSCPTFGIAFLPRFLRLRLLLLLQIHLHNNLINFLDRFLWDFREICCFLLYHYFYSFRICTPLHLTLTLHRISNPHHLHFPSYFTHIFPLTDALIHF